MIVWHSVRSGWLQVFSFRRHTLFDQQTSHGASLSVSQFYPVIHGQQQHQNQPKCGRVGTVVGTVCIIREKSCELKNTHRHRQTDKSSTFSFTLLQLPPLTDGYAMLCYAMPFLFREFEFELSFFCPLTVVVVPHHCGCTTSSSQCCCCC